MDRFAISVDGEGKLILEQARLTRLDPDVLDTIFEVLVRDASALAVELHGKSASTSEQQQWALESIRKPVVDEPRDDRVYTEIRTFSGAYVMRD